MSGSLAYKGEGRPVTAEQALELVEQAIRESGRVTYDTETVGLKDRTMIGLGLCSKGHRVYLTVESPLIRRALGWLSNPHVLKIGHNLMFDLDVVEAAADFFGVDGPDDKNIADTSIMAQVQGLPANLSVLAATCLALEIKEISDILEPRKTMVDVEMQVTAAKCMDDVKATELLWEKFQGPLWLEDSSHSWEPVIDLEFGWLMSMPGSFEVTRGIKDCYRVDLKLISVLRQMSRKGLALRQDRLTEWYKQLSYEVLELEDICKREGFNPGSNQQVGYVLASRGTVLRFTKSGKQLKVNEEVLEGLADPLAAVVLRHRRANKLLGTYVRPWLGQQRAYTHFRTDLSTGRLASSDRNMQNIPPALRDIFKPDTGIWSWADASQIEMRVFAYLSQDERMLKAYRDGEDIHWITQNQLWPGSLHDDADLRLKAKTFNFAMIFYARAETLSKHTKIPLTECTAYRQEWLSLYHGGAAYMESQMALETGWVETDFGRRCRLPDPMMFTQDHINKCKINYPVQGTAADIIKRCMLIGDLIGLDMRVQVHDEILVDGKMEVPRQWEQVHPSIWTPFDKKQGAVWV